MPNLLNEYDYFLSKHVALSKEWCIGDTDWLCFFGAFDEPFTSDMFID